MLISLASRISCAVDDKVDNTKNDAGDSAGGNSDELPWMWSMGCWSVTDQEGIKRNVITLMEAAGHALHITDHHKLVPELLQIFHVGTEC